MNNILHRAALAIATHLRTLADAEDLADIESTSIFAMQERGPAGTDADAEEEVATLPKVTVRATQGQWQRGSGNCVASVEIEIASDGDVETVTADHADRVTAVMDALATEPSTDITTSLSAAITSFTCFGFEIRGIAHSVEGRKRVETISAEMLCAPSDIS